MRSAAPPLAALAITGCGLLTPTPPDWVTNRQSLPSCGEESGGPNAEGRECLLEAFESERGAEFVSHESTIEGDPITNYFRVHETGVVEIFVDATQDKFGSEQWERIRCEMLTAVPDERVFAQIGCEELPVP
jgi:hypothetical protein